LQIVSQVRWQAPQTKVVVLTAIGTPALEAEALRLGADAFLRKPQPLTKVAATVDALIASAAPKTKGTPSSERKGMVMTSSQARAAGAKKVLVVDDSKTALFMQTTILKQGPYELMTASDGEEAVEVAERERPDLIVMDVVMPKMTGFEACRELRRRATTRGIPIILVTTRGEEDNIKTGYEAGCDDYLTKPVSAPALLAKVKNCIGGH
jgi:DNA-binding response OmpR family regulator